MKKLIDLKNERTSKIEAMQVIVARMEAEADAVKRTADQTQWDVINSEIEGIDNEIKTLERQEQLNKTIVRNKVVETPEDKVVKRYDLFKAIREEQNGKLEGLELEMSQEAAREFKNAGQTLGGLGVPSIIYRADVNTTNQSTQLNALINNGLDVIQSPSLITQLGITVYNDLVGSFALPYDDQQTAYFVSEGGSLTGASVGNTSTILAARRVGITQNFSKEYLAQTSAGVQSDRLADFVASLDRAKMRDLLTNVGDLTPIAAYTGATATTYAMFVAMMAAVEAGDGAKYVTTRTLMAQAMGTAVDAGSGILVWKDGLVAGFQAFGTTLAVADEIYFGNWNKAVIGNWGGLEIIVDPFANKKTGGIEITVNALSDTGLSNPNAFSYVLMNQ